MRPALKRAGWWVIAVALSPVLAIQIVWAVTRTPAMPEPDGPRQGVAGKENPATIRLLILGDSSAAGVGVDHQDQALLGRTVQRFVQSGLQVKWRLVARTGARTRDTIQRLRDAQVGPCDVVVIGLGVNDATHMVPERRWLEDTETLLDLIRTELGNPLVLMSGFPPIGQFPALLQPLRTILGWRATMMDDARQRRLADAPNVVQMPFDMPLTTAHMAMDGFHPGTEVYDRWAAVSVATWLREARPAIDVPNIKA